MHEKDFSADQQVAFFEETVEVYEKHKYNLSCLIGNNCAVKYKISSITSIPPIDWCCYKFYLAVEKWIYE